MLELISCDSVAPRLEQMAYHVLYKTTHAYEGAWQGREVCPKHESHKACPGIELCIQSPGLRLAKEMQFARPF